VEFIWRPNRTDENEVECILTDVQDLTGMRVLDCLDINECFTLRNFG
jgi:hypothetical protein